MVSIRYPLHSELHSVFNYFLILQLTCHLDMIVALLGLHISCRLLGVGGEVCIILR